MSDPVSCQGYFCCSGLSLSLSESHLLEYISQNCRDSISLNAVLNSGNIRWTSRLSYRAQRAAVSSSCSVSRPGLSSTAFPVHSSDRAHPEHHPAERNPGEQAGGLVRLHYLCKYHLLHSYDHKYGMVYTNMFSSTTVFNINDNKCFSSPKSAY